MSAASVASQAHAKHGLRTSRTQHFLRTSQAQHFLRTSRTQPAFLAHPAKLFFIRKVSCKTKFYEASQTENLQGNQKKNIFWFLPFRLFECFFNFFFWKICRQKLLFCENSCKFRKRITCLVQDNGPEFKLFHLREPPRTKVRGFCGSAAPA